MRSAGFLISGLFALMSSGCAGSLQTADGDLLRITSREFRSYAERVFRLQNRIADEISFALEDPARLDAALTARLEASDDALFEACAALNEVAARRLNGRSRRPFKDAAAARTVPVCERAALSGEQLLRQMDASDAH